MYTLGSLKKIKRIQSLLVFHIRDPKELQWKTAEERPWSPARHGWKVYCPMPGADVWWFDFRVQKHKHSSNLGVASFFGKLNTKILVSSVESFAFFFTGYFDFLKVLRFRSKGDV